MTQSTDDAGTAQALLERLERWRLPRALAVKERVDAGELLTDSDIQFLKTVLEDAGSVQVLVARNPEYQSLVARVTNLYDEITRKALENEQAQAK